MLKSWELIFFRELMATKYFSTMMAQSVVLSQETPASQKTEVTRTRLNLASSSRQNRPFSQRALAAVLLSVSRATTTSRKTVLAYSTTAWD